VARSQSTGSLRLKFTSSARPVGKLPVRIQLQSLTSLPRAHETRLTLDDSGVASINLPPAAYAVHVETTGFDDYSLDRVNIQAGESTTIEATVEPVEELPIIRLPDEQLMKFVVACQVSSSAKVGSDRLIFRNSRQWTELWSQFKLTPPDVDFKKWTTVASITRSNETGAVDRMRRITYNPKQKVTRIRFDSPPQRLIRQPAFSCDADFVLIPHRAGDVAFSFTTGQSFRH
jgi:hypothetical protein